MKLIQLYSKRSTTITGVRSRLKSRPFETPQPYCINSQPMRMHINQTDATCEVYSTDTDPEVEVYIKNVERIQVAIEFLSCTDHVVVVSVTSPLKQLQDFDEPQTFL